MYGAQTKFGIARQASAGTGVTDATSFHPFPFLTEDVGYEREDVRSQNLNGRFEQGAVYAGPANIAGTIEFELTPRNLGAALAAAVNHSPASVSSGSVRLYTFLPNTQDFSATLCKAPFTIYKQWSDANSAEHYYDVQFGQLDLVFGAGAFSRGRIVAAGGTRTATGIGSAAITPAASDIGRLFVWNVASVSLGGSALSNASEITVSVNDNIEPIYTINGTLAPFKYTRNGFREVNVNFTFYMNDRSQLNDFTSDTARRLVITAVNTRAAIQSGYYDTLTVDIPQFRITNFKPGNSGPGEVSVSGTAFGEVDATSNYSIQFTLMNSYTAGY